MATAAAPSLAIPGQLLGPVSKYQPGPGTHVHEANLYSSLLGVVHVSQPARAPGPAKRLNKITPAPAPAELPTISVEPAPARPAGSGDGSEGQGQQGARRRRRREVLPEVGNVVLCRVVRITPRQAVVSILVCGDDSVLEAEWQGLIRVQDVRATEKDRVKIYESFRPGDIVRAEVVCFFFFFFFSLRLIPLPLPLPCAVADVVYAWLWADLAGRPGQLLPVHGAQRARRHPRDERGRQPHVPRQLAGVQGPRDGPN